MRLRCNRHNYYNDVITQRCKKARENSQYSREEVVLYLREKSGQSDRWKTLNKEKRLDIERSLIEDMRKIIHRVGDSASKEYMTENAKYFSEMIYLLGKLGARPHHVDDNFLATLWKVYEIMSPNKYIGKTMYGLALMGILWKDIPQKTSKALVATISRELEGMGELSLVNLVYSMGKMEIGWYQMPMHTRKRICSNLVRVSPSMDSRAVAEMRCGG